jgi:hypothetical protein
MPAHLILFYVITLIVFGEEYSLEGLGSFEVNGD